MNVNGRGLKGNGERHFVCEVRVERYKRRSTGEKYYKAVVYFVAPQRGVRLMRRRFKRAQEARWWGERFVRRLEGMMPERTLPTPALSTARPLPKGRGKEEAKKGGANG